jgi:Ca2+-binding EF-hand superfamily protein
MSRKTLVAVLITVAGATITLALLRSAAPLDGETSPEKRADSQPPGPGGRGGPLSGFGPGMFMAPQVLEIADANGDGSLSPEEAAKAIENLVREADSEKKGSIDAAALGRAINRRIGPPDGGPGGPPDGPGGPPGGGPGGRSGFGPGAFLGPRILEAADANKDGRLSPEEAAIGAARFVREADTNNKGSLDQGTLAEAINQHIGPPPGSDPGGPMGQEQKLLKQFDKDADGRLDQQERKTRRS